MAISSLAAQAGQFHRAITAYEIARSIRRSGMSEVETDTSEDMIHGAFVEVVKARAFSPGEAAAKGQAIIHEYLEGEIPPWMLQSLVDDLRSMAQ